MIRYAFTVLAAWGILTGTLAAQGGTGRYTQTPEVAPAVTADSLGQPAAPAIGDKFAKGPQPEWVWGPNPNGSYTLSRKFQYQPGDKVLLKAPAETELTLRVMGGRGPQARNGKPPAKMN